MFGTTFGHGTIRKYVIFFGTIFNNIWINRYNSSNTLIQTMKVPLNYGPREKFLARLDGNPNLDRPIAMQLPRMSFELTNIYYDTSRKTSTLNKVMSTTSDSWQYMPVPYNFEFTLSIMVKNAEDGTFIIEQILPYFTPDWTGTLNLNPDLGIKYDIPLVFENITHEDTYEGAFDQRRALIWTLTFTMKGYLFGPTKSTLANIIKEIDVNLRVPTYGYDVNTANSTTTGAMINIDIQPGKYANGSPANSTFRTATVLVDNVTGTFSQGEKLSANSTSYAFLAYSNSTSFTTWRFENLANSTILTGEVSGAQATVNSVSYSPIYPVTANSVNMRDTYGYLIEFTENM